jgi:hypothetical protein
MIITLPDNRRKGNQHRSPTPTGAAPHPGIPLTLPGHDSDRSR